MNNNKLVTGMAFLMIGMGLFLYVYQGINFRLITDALKGLRYYWIFLSIVLGLISTFIRAMRWKMLIESIGYRPKLLNLFLSIQVLYFMNLVIPRGGEVARCGLIARYEKVPFSKLLGTVFIERITDFVAYMVILACVFFWQLPRIREIFSNIDISQSSLFSKILFFGLAALLLVFIYLLFNKLGLLKKMQGTIKKIKDEIIEGLKSILIIEKKWTYLFQTVLIYVLWLFMLYVIFFAYTPTSGMTISAAIFADTVGTLAFLLPIQAGIGVWHFLVTECLHLFGLNKESGKMFALIAHTFINFSYLILGTIGFIVMPVICSLNRKPETVPTVL